MGALLELPLARYVFGKEGTIDRENGFGPVKQPGRGTVQEAAPIWTAVRLIRFRSCLHLQLFPEGVPATGRELLLAAIVFQHQNPSLCCNFSNRSECQIAECLGKRICFGRRRGEQQLVILSAVQCELVGVERPFAILLLDFD